MYIIKCKVHLDIGLIHLVERILLFSADEREEVAFSVGNGVRIQSVHDKQRNIPTKSRTSFTSFVREFFVKMSVQLVLRSDMYI